MRAPAFWWRRSGWQAVLLEPLSVPWIVAGRLRHTAVDPSHAGVPVICVGNVVAGGAGKTPVALAVAAALSGRAVHFLTRGYGGRLAGPVRVDPAVHGYREIGDEPLLLARAAPTWVARRRAEGARAAVGEGADVLIMDDGFQNPGLHKDLSLLVVDGATGIGNGLVMPAGPLREPVMDALMRADAAVLIGRDVTGIEGRLRERLPVLRARIVPEPGAAVRLAGRRVLAFAGIGRPQKVFDSLIELGADVVAMHAFDDHHPYGHDEVAALVDAAARLDAVPVTTAKDHVRLPPEARPLVEVLPVTVAWQEPAALDALLAPLVQRRGGDGCAA